jgi:arylsulfatase A-like enzyme
VIVDDATGTANGIPVAAGIGQATTAAGLGTTAPSRGDNARAGDFKTPGTTTANVVQQNWLIDVATRVVLPDFKRRGKPFVMVYWSRDPDASQHNHGDSHGTIGPGINGPTVRAGIRNADDNLRRLREALVTLDLAATTNIIVAADHGFSTISKESRTSTAARRTYADVMNDRLPPGFLAIDLGEALQLPVWDDARRDAPLSREQHPRGTSLIGMNPSAPDVMVVPNGGSDLVYLPGGNARSLAPRVVNALMAQDYVSGIFADDRLGAIPGTLPTSAINLVGSGTMPRPSLVVNFRSFSSGCAIPTTCGVAVADVTMQQGQGFHGSFSRAETFNFMAAAGPDFKTRYVDAMPVGNPDVAPTIASLLGLELTSKGALSGRVLREALKNGRTTRFTSKTLRSAPDRDGLRTILQYQLVGDRRYFDAAGFRGRTLGLKE